MGLLDQAPRLTITDAEAVARDLYDLNARAVPLPSERDQNFRLDAADGRYVLKIANALESSDVLDAQTRVLEYVARHVSFCPRVIPSRRGAVLERDGHGYVVRLVTWMPGVPLAEVRYRPDELLEDLGRRLGELDRGLEGFDHPALHRGFHWDLEGAVPRALGMVHGVAPGDWRDAIACELTAIGARLESIALLRRSVIHNDANDHNVLVVDDGDPWTRRRRVSGVIDFGDMVYSRTVHNVAVAIAYASLNAADPLRAASSVARGYHAAHGLDEAELAILFDLVKLRLCLSVVLAADQRKQRPGDEYLAVSQDAIRRTLPILSRVHPRFAEATLRHACGLAASPRARRIGASLAACEAPVHAVIAADRIVPISLAVDSPLVTGRTETNSEAALTARIAARLAEADATAGAGGYLEARLLYSSPLFDGHDGERRTIHLGIDIFAAPGTEILAPIGGVVHALADRRAPLDYGPVVLLRHQTDEGDEFYTLYGHLNRDALAAWQPGACVEPGALLGRIGESDVNGGWTPHVHVQLLTDLFDLGCDVPGVCRPSECTVWEELSPDPNLLLRLPEQALPARRPRRAVTHERRRARLGGSVRLGYREPLRIVRGWMQYLYDDAGRRYLDAYNNVPHVGHSHPRIVRRAAEQLAVLNTNTRYLHDLQVEFAERLCRTLPPGLDVCYFVSSGSEANELALRLARAYTRRRGTIVLEASYHGNTSTLIDISPYKFDGPGGSGRPPWVHVAPLPDVYRGVERDPDTAGLLYADALGEIVDRLTTTGSGVCAFVAESSPSVGGQIVLPDGYLRRAYEHVRRGGGVCVADEVQTAYGRTGSHFYAFEAHNVVPDIVVLGKPIGNGYPLGAVVTTNAIAASFDNGMEFFSTFGGSTVSCAVGCEVLRVVEEEALQPHAARVGAALLDRLAAIAGRHPLVGDVRGSGFFLGVELVTDPDRRIPAPAHADYVVNRLRELGILIGTDGADHNVLKIRPPMPFDEGDALLLAATLDTVLAELA